MNTTTEPQALTPMLNSWLKDTDLDNFQKELKKDA